MEKLTLIQVAALRVSFFRDREVRPEHAVSLIMRYAQQRTLEVVRGLPQRPTLVVLRSEGSRVLSEEEIQKLGFAVKSARIEVAAGSRVPTLLRESDREKEHDILRIKPNSRSGLINSVQIACCLLGIEPIPAAQIASFIPNRSQKDRLKHMTTVPPLLRAEIEKRQRTIREILATRAPIECQ